MADLTIRADIEQGLAADIAATNRPIADRLARYIAGNPSSPNIPASIWNELEQENAELLAIWLLLTWRESTSRHGWRGDAADAAGYSWAASRSAAVAKSFVETTRQRVDTAVSEWQQRAETQAKQVGQSDTTHGTVPGFSIDQSEIDARLESILGPDRVATTAVNEVSNAITDASDAAMDAQGLLTATDVWRTEKDARVCTICSPLEGKPRSYWQGIYDAGPPAHPNCRCWIEYTNEGQIQPTGDYSVSTQAFTGRFA